MVRDRELLWHGNDHWFISTNEHTVVNWAMMKNIISTFSNFSPSADAASKHAIVMRLLRTAMVNLGLRYHCNHCKPLSCSNVIVAASRGTASWTPR